MDACVIPIELIDVVCRFDYANWLNLSLSCRRIRDYLAPLRWNAKSALTVVGMRHWVHWDCTCFNIRRGKKVKVVTTQLIAENDEVWYIYVINHHKNNVITGEAVYLKYGVDIDWYHDDICVADYRTNMQRQNHYHIHRRTNGASMIGMSKDSTRDDVKRLLDDLGATYNWLNWLPHDT